MWQGQLGSYAEKVERFRSLALWLAGVRGTREAGAGRSARPPGQGGPRDRRWWVSSPSSRASWAASTRAPAASRRRWPLAIFEHYLPRFVRRPAAGFSAPVSRSRWPTSSIPWSASSRSARNQTGTRDPYGLRRAAIGVLRILIETGIALDLRELIRAALDSVTADVVRLGGKPPAEGLAEEIYGYMMERLRAWYLEAGGGITTEMFDAVLDTRPASPLDFDHRLRALADPSPCRTRLG